MHVSLLGGQWYCQGPRLCAGQHGRGFISVLIWQKDLSYVVVSPGGWPKVSYWGQRIHLESLGFSGGPSLALGCYVP